MEDSGEFLMKEYDGCWKCLIDTYNRNESWFKFYILFLTLTVGIIGAISKIETTQKNVSNVWVILLVLLTMLYVFGIATLIVLYNNRKIIVEYLNAINRIRRFFVERATETDPNFCKYVVLPWGTHKHFRVISINLILIYVLSFFNFLTLSGVLLISAENLKGLKESIDAFISNNDLPGIKVMAIIISFVVNVFFLALTIHFFYKKDRRSAEKEIVEWIEQKILK